MITRIMFIHSKQQTALQKVPWKSLQLEMLLSKLYVANNIISIHESIYMQITLFKLGELDWCNQGRKVMNVRAKKVKFAPFQSWYKHIFY